MEHHQDTLTWLHCEPREEGSLSLLHRLGSTFFIFEWKGERSCHRGDLAQAPRPPGEWAPRPGLGEGFWRDMWTKVTGASAVCQVPCRVHGKRSRVWSPEQRGWTCADPWQTRGRQSRSHGSAMPLSAWTQVLQVWASGRETGGWKDRNSPDATWNVGFFVFCFWLGTVTWYTKILLQMKI